MTEILTSHHLRGREEGREEGRVEGSITVLQRALLKQSKRKFGAISSDLEMQIMKNTNIPQLENALENMFDFDNEEALLKKLEEKLG